MDKRNKARRDIEVNSGRTANIKYIKTILLIGFYFPNRGVPTVTTSKLNNVTASFFTS